MNQLALPAHLQKYQSRDLSQTLSQNLGAASPPYVSIAGGRFTLIDAAGNELPGGAFDQKLGVYLDACIIDAGDHISRVYYEKDYDPSAQTFSPPDCWSDNGVGPSTACGKPQGSTCAACQWSTWGSATSAQGKAIPACQQVQKVALIVPAQPQTVFLLRVPPNSHKHLRSYNEKSKQNGVDLSNVITRIYFDQTTQGTLLFNGVAWIDDAVAQVREAAYVEKKTDTIVGRNDVARSPTLLAPAQGAPLVGTAPTQQIAAPQQQVLQNAPLVPSAQVQTQLPAGSQTPTGGPVAAPQQPAGAAPQRRRRRTAAEMQAANAAPVTQPAQATAAPQAPFPHSVAPNSLPGQTDLGFGMASGQPVGANPEVAQAIESFFQT